jgi:hypothetical protein
MARQGRAFPTHQLPLRLPFAPTGSGGAISPAGINATSGVTAGPVTKQATIAPSSIVGTSAVSIFAPTLWGTSHMGTPTVMIAGFKAVAPATVNASSAVSANPSKAGTQQLSAGINATSQVSATLQGGTTFGFDQGAQMFHIIHY